DVATHTDTVFGVSQAQAASSAGRSIYHWLLFVMLALICFIVPGLTAGAIAGERERQTLIPLQITLLSPRSIVFGKLLASLAFVVLLLNPFAATGEVVRGRNAAFVNLSSPFTPFQEMIATDSFHGVSVDGSDGGGSSGPGAVIRPVPLTGPMPMPVPLPPPMPATTVAVAVPRAAVVPDSLG